MNASLQILFLVVGYLIVGAIAAEATDVFLDHQFPSNGPTGGSTDDVPAPIIYVFFTLCWPLIIAVAICVGIYAFLRGMSRWVVGWFTPRRWKQ